MKFEKLVKILSEAKNEQPGARFFSVQNREGPAGIVSGPIGKSDNFELQKNLDRWEYNPSQNKGKSGFSDESKIWKSMLTSFRLLFNDPFFDKQVKKITKRFNESRDSYKNLKTVADMDGNNSFEKYDEENQLEKLERNQSKYRSDIEGFKKDIKSYNTTINYSKMPPGKVIELRKELARLDSQISISDELKKEDKNYKEYAKIKKDLEMNKKTLQDLGSKVSFSKDSSEILKKIDVLKSEIKKIERELQTKNKFKRLAKLDHERDNDLNRLNRLTDILLSVRSNPEEIDKINSLVSDVESKMVKWEDKLKKTTEELELLYDRINQINETNENADSVAKNGFLDLIKFTAGGLAKEYETKVGEIANTSPDQVDWNNPIETLLDAVNKLKALASDDENINPILGYLARFERDYRDKEFDTGRALDKNVNITTMRDFNKLPFMVLSRIYSSLRSSDKTPIALDKLDTNQSDATQGELMALLDKISPNNEESKAEWTNPNTKTYIKGLIDQLLMSNFSKEQMKKRVDRPWLVDRGKTPSALLKLNIENETSTKNESFDDYFDNLMLEMAFDEDDYKTDLIEILEKCTGPTKKASSDRKGKKWMKCAKQPDGSYKKIHFGQKGVRVGGGNSKRAKAFRSRHDCKNAKQGSPQQASCQNW
jgi:hypothetical protein